MNDTQWTTLTINNAIPSGAAFGYEQTTGASCFIPASVMFNTGAQIGDTVEALLIENPNLVARARTPYMVQQLQTSSRHASPTVTPRPAPIVTPTSNTADLAEFVEDRMQDGGVWTVAELLSEYGAAPDDTRAQHIVASVLRSMFAHKECSTWVMYTNGDATVAAKEWFSCFPNNVDVAEWE